MKLSWDSKKWAPIVKKWPNLEVYGVILWYPEVISPLQSHGYDIKMDLQSCLSENNLKKVYS